MNEIYGQSAASPLDDAHCIAVDGTGNVYVANTGKNQVLKIDADGSASVLPATGNSNEPSAVVVDASGKVYVATRKGELYSVDSGGATSIATGTRVFSALAVDATGTAYVIDSQAGAVLAGGTGTPILDNTGVTSLKMQDPAGIAVDKNGVVYVASAGTDSVFKYDPKTTTKSVLYDGSAGGVLDEPRAIAVDDAGNVFVAGFASDNVVRIAPDGTSTVVLDRNCGGIGVALDEPTGLAILANDEFVVIGASSDNAIRVRVHGTKPEVELLIPGSDGSALLDSPSSIAVAGNRQVYALGGSSDNVLLVDLGVVAPTDLGIAALREKAAARIAQLKQEITKTTDEKHKKRLEARRGVEIENDRFLEEVVSKARVTGEIDALDVDVLQHEYQVDATRHPYSKGSFSWQVLAGAEFSEGSDSFSSPTSYARFIGDTAFYPEHKEGWGFGPHAIVDVKLSTIPVAQGGQSGQQAFVESQKALTMSVGLDAMAYHWDPSPDGHQVQAGFIGRIGLQTIDEDSVGGDVRSNNTYVATGITVRTQPMFRYSDPNPMPYAYATVTYGKYNTLSRRAFALDGMIRFVPSPESSLTPDDPWGLFIGVTAVVVEGSGDDDLRFQLGVQDGLAFLRDLFRLPMAVVNSN